MAGGVFIADNDTFSILEIYKEYKCVICHNFIFYICIVNSMKRPFVEENMIFYCSCIISNFTV